MTPGQPGRDCHVCRVKTQPLICGNVPQSLVGEHLSAWCCIEYYQLLQTPFEETCFRVIVVQLQYLCECFLAHFSVSVNSHGHWTNCKRGACFWYLLEVTERTDSIFAWTCMEFWIQTSSWCYWLDNRWNSGPRCCSTGISWSRRSTKTHFAIY